MACVVWHAEKPAVCTFDTPPCVPATRPHVSNMWALAGTQKKTHVELSLAPEVHQVTTGSYPS